VQRALFPSALAGWFNANLDQFTYVFSIVNIGARAAKEDFQWLKPTYTSYAYFNGATDDESYFGVLNLTANRTPDGLTNQLPPSAIPADCQASILISNNMFLRNMILPGLTKSFSKATVSDFTIATTGTVLESLNAITLDKVEIDGSDYTPEMLSFTLQIVGDEIQIDTETKVNISPGIDVFVSATEYYRITLVNKPDDGGQTLDFAEARDPDRSHRVETATWVWLTDLVVGIAAAVAFTVAGKVIQTLARKIIAVLIIALVSGLIGAIPKMIALVMEGKAAEALPAIGQLVMEASSDVEWPGSTGFTLKSAQLNGSFQLGGDLTPIPA
jgi:hypothetical protein